MENERWKIRCLWKER